MNILFKFSTISRKYIKQAIINKFYTFVIGLLLTQFEISYELIKL